MENNPQNAPLYDRKVKYCQFRIQEAINIRDDEIGRIARRLNQYKSLILEANEKIADLSLKIQEEAESKTGEKKRRHAELSVAIARIKASHHQAIQDTQKHQADEIDNIQQEFEVAMSSLKQTTRFRYSNQTSDIDQEIKKMMTQIETYKTERNKILRQTSNVEENDDNNIEELNFGVIEQLQRIIQTRNEERFESLRQSKVKLAHCVDTIEEMMRNHSIRVNEMQKRLKEMDDKYETDCQRLEEKQGYKISALKSHYSEVQKRTYRLLNAAKRLDQENQKQLKETIKDLDGMKEKCYAISEDVSGIDDDRMNLLNSLRVELPKMRRQIKVLDNVLMDKRAENESLRREVGEYRHHLRFSSSQFNE